LILLIMMFCVWLLFEKNDHDYLANLISILANRYNSPTFLPHITVFGITEIKLEILEDIIRNASESIRSFKVEKLGLNHSTDIWKSFFIDLKLNSKLKQINSRIEKELEHSNYNHFDPHISLIYKKINLSKKKELFSEIHVKKKFKVNRISIMRFSKDVSKWKIIKKINLDKNA